MSASDEVFEETESVEDEDSLQRKTGSSAAMTPEVTFTVDEAINKMGFGSFQVLITVFCGLLWLADAMELMILSILSPIVKCQWDLSSFAEACVTVVVFTGVMMGAVFWGFMNDAIGRKKSMLVVDILVLGFGILSALQISADDSYLPGYPWLLICRFGVGFTSAGTSQTITYYAEFLPQKGRGIWLIMIAGWWTVGTMFCAALAALVLGVLQWSWHWFLGLAALPLAMVLVLFPLVPESARYYLVKGKNEEAMKVIRRVAKLNCKKPLSGRLVLQEDKEKEIAEKEVVVFSNGEVSLSDVTLTGFVSNREEQSDEDLSEPEAELIVREEEVEGPRESGSPSPVMEEFLSDTESAQLLQDEEKSSKYHGMKKKARSTLCAILTQMSPLFKKGMWRTTVLLWFIWFGGAWLYYGAVILTTNLLRYDPHCSRSPLNETNSTEECYELDTGDYVKILWSSAAEIPGLIITFIIIDIIGRKKTMGIEFVLSAGSFLLLLICASDVVLTVFLFVVRALVTGVFQVAYVYTPEVYPTKSRALGLGLCNMMARVGGIVTPIVADVVYEANDYVCIGLYAGSCLIFAVMAMLLPIETKGRALKDKGS